MKENYKHPLLQKLQSPADLKAMDSSTLGQLASEIRSYIKQVVEINGGHLGPNLGTVELIIACHTVFNLAYDRLVFDVGHQVYPHKILTGRYLDFLHIRKENGLSGYPSQYESPYDVFRSGHASTAVSTGLGLQTGYSILQSQSALMESSKPNSTNTKNPNPSAHPQVIALIGDGSMTGGMAFEGLNHAGDLGKRLIIILNDNAMSISPTVGGLAKTLLRFRRSPFYTKLRDQILEHLKKIPKFGYKLETLTNNIINDMVTITSPSQIFTALGFHYFGPVNGHDIGELQSFLQAAKQISKPVIIHAITRKGGGYQVNISEKVPEIQSVAVEDSPHALSPKKASPSPPASSNSSSTSDADAAALGGGAAISYSSHIAEALIKLARKNKKIVGITAAMPQGTGLNTFEKQFPKRYFDVGICEAHATGFAAGLAKSGLQAVFCVYSTFLQRAFDQIFHEVVLQQDVNVIFAIDRAGLVGEDGPSHQGIYDIAYTRIFPGFTVMAPKDGLELEEMLAFALKQKGPVAIRYPKGSIPEPHFFETLQTLHTKDEKNGLSLPTNTKTKQKSKPSPLRLGKAETLLHGEHVALLCYGSTVYQAALAAKELYALGMPVTLVNARFAKPIDTQCILHLASSHTHIVAMEEASLQGGFSSALLETLAEHEQGKYSKKTAATAVIHRLGVPDRLIEHASRNKQLQLCALDSASIMRKVQSLWPMHLGDGGGGGALRQPLRKHSARESEKISSLNSL